MSDDGENCVTEGGAIIGENCKIYNNCFIEAGATIGENCVIMPNVSILDGVTLGNFVFIGPGVAFPNDKHPRALQYIYSPGKTIVEEGASIGANAVIMSGIKIGHHAMIGAGAIVTKFVTPHTVVIGNPARFAGWICRCGRMTDENISAFVDVNFAEKPSSADCEYLRHAGETVVGVGCEICGSG